MHVLLLTYEFHPTNGGVANASVALCRALREHADARVSVVVGRSWWPWEERVLREEWEGMALYRIPYTGLPEERPLRQTARTLLFCASLAPRVLRLRPDVIIAQRSYDLGLFAALFGRLAGATTFAYAHGPDDTQHMALRPWRQRLNRLALRWNAAVLVTNSAFAAMFRALDARGRVELLPNIVAIDPVPESPAPYAALDGRFHVACAGRAVIELGIETKGFSGAIEALRALPDCHLHLYGEGPQLPALRELAQAGGVADRVTFHGALPRADLHRELLRADCFLHPALVEGLPMVVLEALALGLPVIATSVGGLPDVIRDGDTGWLIPPGDAGAIARALDHARLQPGERRDVARRGRALVAAEMTGAAVVARLRDIIASPSRSGA